jgi:hypothetical protein
MKKVSKHKTVRALIIATNKDTRDIYYQAIKTSTFIGPINQAKDLEELKQLTLLHSYRYLFVGEVDHLKTALSDCKCHLLENMPATRMVLLGMAWSDNENSAPIYPIRGVIDLRLQTHPELHKSLNRIHKHGFDFNLVIEQHPKMSQAIKKHAANMPINDNRFLEFLPLLGVRSSMIQNAQYLGLSERTLRHLREKWRVQLDVADHYEMHQLALELGWTTPQSSHAAGQRLQEFLNAQGAYNEQ